MLSDEITQRRYQLALRVVRQWRNLRALKRGGMGNDPDCHTSETREGELAADCLACPKAGVNLPEGWERVPVEMRYVLKYFSHRNLSADCWQVPLHNFSGN
jgi:hypothetical protein